MNTDKNTNNGSANTITVGGLLRLTLIILKLCKGIDWSWFWAFFPYNTFSGHSHFGSNRSVDCRSNTGIDT